MKMFDLLAQKHGNEAKISQMTVKKDEPKRFCSS